MQNVHYGFFRIVKTEVFKKCQSVGRLMFNKYLFCTNVGISITLSGVGDVLQQHHEILNGEQEKWNNTRTFNMSISGFTVGIVCHNTYRYLDLFFPGRTFQIVMKKVVLDQLVCSPLYISTFFATMAFLEDSSIKQFVDEMNQKAWKLYVAECAIWPPAQVFNFYFLSPKFRVLYDNTISLGFDVYTSYLKHSPLEEEEEEENVDKKKT